jgi:hypothetical protein
MVFIIDRPNGLKATPHQFGIRFEEIRNIRNNERRARIPGRYLLIMAKGDSALCG